MSKIGLLLVGIWSSGLSDESVEDMTNSNLHVMRFLGLSLEDDVPDHSVLSRFTTRRKLQRNRLITKVRYVVERIFGNQAR
ncbi:MAG: transposase [Nitrosomonas sp.]|nr:transposase [Nitrosomonas sp.]